MKKFFIILCSLIFGLNCFADTCVLTPDMFSTESYAANDTITHSCTSVEGVICVFETTNVMQNQYKQIQIKAKVGVIDIPDDIIVDSIEINLGTSKYMNLTIVADKNITPTQINDTIYKAVVPAYNSLSIINTSKYAASQKSITLHFHKNVPTSLVTPAIQQTSEKVLLNGQIIIRKGEEIYNIMGQKL